MSLVSFCILFLLNLSVTNSNSDEKDSMLSAGTVLTPLLNTGFHKTGKLTEADSLLCIYPEYAGFALHSCSKYQ